MYKISDSHNDFLIETKPTKKDIKNYLTFLELNNVKNINFAFFTTQTQNFKLSNVIKIKKYTNNFLKKSNFDLKIQFSFEDMNFFNLDEFDTLKNIAPLCCSLTWNHKNKFAGGAYSNGNLTQSGKILISLLQKNNIFVDTAHINKKSFYSICDISSKPLINTHCCLDIIKHHKRNLDNEQVKIIIENGGYIGIAFVQDFFDKRYIFNSDYLAQCIVDICLKYGINNIGIGTDFYGTTKLPYNIKNYNDFYNLFRSLQKLGMKPEEINKIFYKNYNDFLIKYNKI